ncbi:MAG: DUF4097 family beta strand repeat-containing protein [Bryobacteraceae bacterium]
MRVRFLRPLLILPVLCLAGCDIEDWGDMQRVTRNFHYTYPLHAGARLSLETFNGSVEISGSDRDTVDIVGAKYGPTPEAADALRVDIDHTPDSVSIRAVRPTERRNNQGARFTLIVPKTVTLERVTASNGSIRVTGVAAAAHLHTSNGGIHALDLKGDLGVETTNGPVELDLIEGAVHAHTSNGHIHADRLRGGLDATTSNGGIRATVERAGGEVRAETTNGTIDLTLPAGFRSDVRAHTSNSSITLHLPADIDARVDAHTTNGSISSDFEFRVQGEISKNRLVGTIGSGGPLFDLSTVNGSIRLLK